MGRGKAVKRRAKNLMNAKVKGTSVGPLPLPPTQKSADFAPRSFQRMMALKAAVEKKNSTTRRPPVTRPGQSGTPTHDASRTVATPSPRSPDQQQAHLQRLAQDTAAAAAHTLPLPDQQDGAQPVSAPEPDSNIQQGEDDLHPAEPTTAEQPGLAEHLKKQPKKTQGAGKQAGTHSSSRQPSGQGPQSAEALFARKPMRASRKAYLKARKARGKKKAGSGPGDSEDEREAAIMQDHHKPAFGEQAMAPIKVNLKRKHWDPATAEQRMNERCKQVFLKQLSTAERQNALASAGTSQLGPSLNARILSSKGSQLKHGKAAAAVPMQPASSMADKVRTAREAQAREVTRLQLIDAYREQKRQKGAAQGKGKGQGLEGAPGRVAATPQSLADLVQRGKAQQ